MKRAPILVLFTFLALMNEVALADGWKFIKGRFPEGRVTVLKLTPGQRAFLDLVRRCQRDNTRSPYVFTLTPEQSAILRKDAGFSPDHFAIFESYRGDEGVDLEVNVINRFEENEFEIPHKLLTRSREAHTWEVDTMGWLANPLLGADPKKFAGAACPQ